MNWYAKPSAGTGQGLVIDEDTGRNVAVAYDVKDAPLLAAAPALLAACRAATVACPDNGPESIGYRLRLAIREATEEDGR